MAKILDFVRRPAAPAAGRRGAALDGAARGLLDRGDAAHRGQGRRLPRASCPPAPGSISPISTAPTSPRCSPPPAASPTRASRSCRTSRPAASPAAPSSTPASPPMPTSASAQALVLAGGIDRPRGAFAEAMQLLETGRLRRPRLHPTCTSPATPRATATSTPPAASANAMAALARKAASSARPTPRMAIATQFCFEAAPVDRLGRAPARRRHHAAGPHRRRRPGQAADPDPLRHDLRRRPDPRACCSAAPPT